MACDVRFYIKGEEYVIKGLTGLSDQSDLSTIINSLKDKLDDESFQEIWNNIKLSLESTKPISDELKKRMKEMETTGNIVYNYTVGQFSRFNDLSESLRKTKLLLVRDFKSLTNTKLKSGSRVLQGNEEIFIISPKDLDKLYNYLLIKDTLLKNKYIPSEEEQKLFEDFKKRYKNTLKDISDYNELIADFISFESKYSDTLLSKKLKETCDTILGRNGRAKYATNVLSLINQFASFTKDEKGKYILLLLVKDLISILQKDKKYSALLDPETLKQKTFMEYYSKPYDEVKNDSYNDLSLTERFGISNQNTLKKPALSVLIDLILSEDPNFAYDYLFNKNGTLYFMSNAKTLLEEYNYSFNTIKNNVSSRYYHGYYIHRVITPERKVVYHITKGILTQQAFGVSKFDSIEKARNQVRMNWVKLSIYNETIIFRKKYGLSRYSEEIPSSHVKNLAMVINLPGYLNEKNLVLTPREQSFINNGGTVALFFKLFVFNNWVDFDLDLNSDLYEEIVSTLDDYQKILMFLYIVNYHKSQNGSNNSDLKSESDIRFGLDEVRKLTYTWNEVFSKSIIDRSLNIVTTNPEQDINSAHKFFYSKTHFFQLLKYQLKKSVDILLLNLKDLFNKFPNLKKLKKDIKSFISDDKIYINLDKADPSDLLHEYSHIVLGIIKNTQFDTYNQLLTKFNDFISQDKYLSDLYLRISKDYEGLSRMDLLEETLAEALGLNLTLNTNVEESIISDRNKFSELFSGVTPIEGNDIDTVLNSVTTLFDFYDLMKAVASDLIKSMKELFPKNNESYIKQRKVTNFILELIKNKKIIELNCD